MSDVAAFLRESRRLARQNRDHLDQLLSQAQAAALRLAAHVAEPSDLDLIEELNVRDEELRAVADELREQVESMRHAATLLERERSKYLSLFVDAPEAYLVTNLGGVIEEANLAASGLFRAEPGGLAGRPLVSYVARRDTRAFRRLLHELLDARPAPQEPLRAVLRMRPRGQAVFVVSVSVVAVMNDGGSAVALRWVLRDASRSEAKESRETALEELAAMLVDDLRRGLEPIVLWSRLLQTEPLSEDDRRLALQTIERCAASQGSRLDDLSEFSRLPAEPRPAADEADLPASVREVLDALGPERGRIELREVGLAGPPRVRGPSLGRSIALFLGRALDGSPRDELVTVTVRAGAEELSLAVNPPEGARVPEGWAIRTAIATRLAERCGARVVLGETSPAVTLRWPT